MKDKIVKKNRIKSSVFFLGTCLLFLSSFFSCSNVDMAQFEARTAAFGQVNDMVVVADQKVWESAVGDTFRYYFSSAYPILPQPEPVFDLWHWTAGDERKRKKPSIPQWGKINGQMAKS